MSGSKNPKLKAAAAAIAFAAMSAASTGAHAMLPVVDPAAIAQAVRQVAQGAQEINQLQSQLQSQLNMLKSIGTNYASVLPGINSELASILTSAQGIGYNSSNVQGLLSSLYPDATTIGGMTPTTLSNALQAWHNATNQSLQTALQTQQQIAQQQPSMQSAVTSALSASQAAPGQTSAIQATNQLLATVSAQLTQLQAILTTQARTAELAQQQQLSDSAAAYSTAQTVINQVNDTPAPAAPAVTDTSSL